MERTSIEDGTALYDLVVGVYNLVFPDAITVDDIDLYWIDSGRVEAEIEFPALGLNRKAWNETWTPERQLEVLLHEFAHIEEGPGEHDHGPLFYHRLSELTWLAQDHQAELEALFGVGLDFDAVREHVVDSVNEHTVEAAVDSIADRQDALREEFASADSGE